MSAMGHDPTAITVHVRGRLAPVAVIPLPASARIRPTTCRAAPINPPPSLAIVAAEERYPVRVRSNVKHEDVRLYRLKVTPGDARRLLLVYLWEANDLARKPRFYDTPTSNCMTLVFDIARVLHPGLPMDVRVILSGYLPNYAYHVGATDMSIPFNKLRELLYIDAKGARADADPAFSARIREGVPKPHKTLAKVRCRLTRCRTSNTAWKPSTRSFAIRPCNLSTKPDSRTSRFYLFNPRRMHVVTHLSEQ